MSLGSRIFRPMLLASLSSGPFCFILSANAIECLHKEKIAHRDLKPENIVICPRQNKVRLLSWGY